MPEAIAIGRLVASDEAALIACMTIDAQVFPWPSVWMARVLRDHASWVWVARAGGRVVGFAACEERGTSLHVHGLAADPGCRRQGVGRALVRHTVTDALGRRLNEVLLRVMHDNYAALTLYLKEGFLPKRFRPRYYSETKGAIEMARALVGASDGGF